MILMITACLYLHLYAARSVHSNVDEEDSQMTVDFSNPEPTRLSQRIKKERHFGDFIRSDQLSVADSSSSCNTVICDDREDVQQVVPQKNRQVLYNGQVSVDMTPALAQGNLTCY